MNVFYRILAIVMAFSSVSYAQDFTITAPKSPKDDWCGFSENGNFYMFTYGDSKDSYKTKVTTYGTDFKVVSELTSDTKLLGNDLCFVSKDATTFAFDGYINENRIGILNKTGFHKVKTKAHVIYFATDTNLVSMDMRENIIGTDIGWQIEVGNIQSNENEKFLLEEPSFRGKKLYGTWLLDYNNKSFKVAFINKSSEEKDFRNYITVEYDFKGKIIKQNSIEVFLKDAKFSYLNDCDFAFDTYVSSMNRSMVTAISTPLANGVLAYDFREDVYYAYGGYEKKGDASGIFVHKYDTSGKLLWKQRYPLKDFKLKYSNSFNRHLSFTVGANRLGIDLYTSKGKDYCGFYLIDKEKGDLIGSKVLDHYGTYSWSYKYNTIASRYVSKDEPFKNLIFNKYVVYGMLEDPSFTEFVEQMQEDYLLKAYWNAEGLNVLYTGKKKSPEIYFKSFKNPKSF